jgi:predicted HAD superfamily Cof-like phosphohydrolase
MSDSNWMQESVSRLHDALNHPHPQILDLEGVRRKLRAKLILEEAIETVHALGFDVEVHAAPNGELVDFELRDNRQTNWVEAVDGLCDLIYVTMGLGVEAGFSLAPFFAEVHHSNMTKVGGPVREDGKGLKPESWQPPRIGYLWDRLVERAKSGSRTDTYRPPLIELDR